MYDDRVYISWGGLTGKGHEIIFWDDGNVLQIDVLITWVLNIGKIS